MGDQTATDKARKVDRPRGILSKRDREMLLEWDEEDIYSSKGRVARRDVRGRLYNAILDMHLISEELEQRDIDTVSEQLTEQEAEIITQFVQTIRDSAIDDLDEFISQKVEQEIENALNDLSVNVGEK